MDDAHWAEAMLYNCGTPLAGEAWGGGGGAGGGGSGGAP
jgi:hypothetical protein